MPEERTPSSESFMTVREAVMEIREDIKELKENVVTQKEFDDHEDRIRVLERFRSAVPAAATLSVLLSAFLLIHTYFG